MICLCFDPSVVYSQELALSRLFNPHEKPVQPKPHGTEKSAKALNNPPGHSSYKAIERSQHLNLYYFTTKHMLLGQGFGV